MAWRALVGGALALGISMSVALPQAARADGDAPAPTATVSASPAPSATPTPVPTAPAPAPDLRSVSAHSGEVVSSRVLVFWGSGLDTVLAVSLGAARLTGLRHRGDDRLEAVLGPSPRFRTGAASFVLRTRGGQVSTAQRFRFVARTRRGREMVWASAHLLAKSYSWGHPYIPREDCANFVSHALRVRGYPSSVLTTSSSALRRYLVDVRGRRQLADSPAARRQVRIGDVIQFDWDPVRVAPGDRDHTALVSGVSTDAEGRIVLRYIAHTDPFDSPKRDQTIEGSLTSKGHDPHGRVFFILT